MRATYLLLLAATFVVCTSAGAAPCRALKAAELGSKAGYMRDKTAAEEMEKRASESSDVLEKCIKSITAVTVVPTFPSLTDIFTGAMERACKVSIDRVRAALPPGMPGIPVIPGLPGAPMGPGGLVRPVPGIPGVPSALTGMRSRIGGLLSEPPAKSEELWKRIWH
ncbi:hypothetical protein [Massilia sp. NR 4-1]|uniref:hypothetical protein n=1 Tax=Massilia sp. NR 4-1 TaxID=1678028 RepID=UPI0012378936|nr:hypothetical protein [Massilia sp. NR 4-1]